MDFAHFVTLENHQGTRIRLVGHQLQSGIGIPRSFTMEPGRRLAAPHIGAAAVAYNRGESVDFGNVDVDWNRIQVGRKAFFLDRIKHAYLHGPCILLKGQGDLLDTAATLPRNGRWRWPILEALLKGMASLPPPRQGRPIPGEPAPQSATDVTVKAAHLTMDSLLDDLLSACQSIGLYRDWGRATFANHVHDVQATELLEEEVEEYGEEGRDEASARVFRNSVLTRLRGVSYDHRFDAEDILYQVRESMSGEDGEAEVSWNEEVFAPDGPRQIRLRFSPSHELAWQYDSIPGLMLGVNILLERAGSALRFVGLDAASDSYYYVCVDPAARDALLRSPLFALYEEKDACARECQFPDVE